ncbi:hypothetical protein CROQUDRAFT_102296, partial [Cronartium quercuum f. sp. fusiforme G11]
MNLSSSPLTPLSSSLTPIPSTSHQSSTPLNLSSFDEALNPSSSGSEYLPSLVSTPAIDALSTTSDDTIQPSRFIRQPLSRNSSTSKQRTKSEESIKSELEMQNNRAKSEEQPRGQTHNLTGTRRRPPTRATATRSTSTTVQPTIPPIPGYTTSTTIPGAWIPTPGPPESTPGTHWSEVRHWTGMKFANEESAAAYLASQSAANLRRDASRTSPSPTRKPTTSGSSESAATSSSVSGSGGQSRRLGAEQNNPLLIEPSLVASVPPRKPGCGSIESLQSINKRGKESREHHFKRPT